jgi:hypothetical protein
MTHKEKTHNQIVVDKLGYEAPELTALDADLTKGGPQPDIQETTFNNS